MLSIMGTCVDMCRVGMIGVITSIGCADVVPIGSFAATRTESFESIGEGRIRGVVPVFGGAGRISAIDERSRVLGGNAARRGRRDAFDGDRFILVERGGAAFDFPSGVRAWGAVLRRT